MTVALYIRVSTEEQAEQGFSIDAQKDRLIAFCKSQGWDDFKLYIDDGYTGTKTERPALKRLIRHVQDHKIDTVLVYKLDRLSRKQKDVLEILEDVFEANNVVFKSATEPFDTSTAFGKAMIGVLAVFAQLDRDMIVERMTFGRRQRVSMGKWYGGRVPFGYDWNKERQMLEIKPEEARLVKEIFKMYIDGHSRLSIAEWAAKRTNERTIDHNIVRDILTRPIYRGKLKNAGTIVEGNHEAIITEELWEAAQRETRKRKDETFTRRDFLLSGLLKCGICGGNIVHVKRKTVRGNKEYHYDLYACVHQHVRPKNSPHICNMGYLRREEVENFVINRIKNISVLGDKITLNQSDESEQNESVGLLFQLEDQLKRTVASLENLYDAIQNGDIKASSVRDRIKSLEEQRDAIESDLYELTENEIGKMDKDEILQILKQIGKVWDYLTEDEQKNAIRKVVKNVVLKGKENDPEIVWVAY